MWTIFKVFIEFATILLLFSMFQFLARGMWGLSSLTRDQTRTPALEGEVLTSGQSGKSQSSLLFQTAFTDRRLVKGNVSSSTQWHETIPHKTKKKMP